MKRIYTLKIFKLLFISLFLFLSHQTYSQESLTESEKKKIATADKKLEKAEFIVKKADKYTSQIEALKNDGRVRTRKIQKLETKANRIIIKSSSYYKDSYGKKYGSYRSAVQRNIKEGILSTDYTAKKNEAHKTYKIGRKWRRKSNGQANADKGVEYLLKANEVEGTAIESLISILNNVSDIPQPEEQITEAIEDTTEQQALTTPIPPTEAIIEEIPQDSILAIASDSVINVPTDSIPLSAEIKQDSAYITPVAQDSLVLPSNDSLVVSTEIATEEDLIAEQPLEQVAELNTTEDSKTYFTIQFLADKQPVPKEKISSLYSGSLEVIKHEADGWFRYSIGKFKDVNKANETLQSSGVNGYVVAYHNNERISTRQAIEIIAGE